MEPRHRDGDEGDKGSGERQGSDSPSQSGHATGAAGPSASRQVVGTDDPDIMPGSSDNPDWINQPDQTMAIETSRIRGPNEAFHPNFVMVPIESKRPRDGSSESGDKGKGGDKGGGEQGGKGPEKAGDRREDEKREKSSRAPSLTRVLLFSGIVSLVCGVVGAWGYSYFFGSSKSGDEKSSSKSSQSGKSSGGASKGSDSGKDSGSETSQNDEGQGKIRQAEAAWMMAVKELHVAQAEEKALRREEEETKSILSFLKRTLLSTGRPVDASLAAAFWAGGPAKDISLRKAVDLTESQVAETFAERPLAEAAIREMLGLAYLSLGDAAQAVKQYERAFALRQAMQGANAPETADCRNQLAVAYRLAGRTVEGSRLFERNPNSPDYASALAASGSMLLAQKNPAEAELKLRECLAIRQKIQPGDWTTPETKSLLGEALMDQGRFAEAEPLLLSGFEGMRQHAGTIPSREKPRLNRALERLVRLYESWGKEVEAARWRKELGAAAS
jgi:tetratricopeptide (TPR) repeat protein